MSTVQTLRVADLKVRPEYQRKLDDLRVSRMAKNFDPRLAGALEVSDARPNYWVVDGQHRLAAMRKANVKDARVIIHRGLTLAQEAELFARLNTDRRTITPGAMYKAELVAGVPRALEIANALAFYELRAGSHSRTAIQSIGVLYKLQKWEVLDDTLRLIMTSWSNGEGIPVDMALDGRVMNSIGRFILRMSTVKHFDDAHFRQVLMRHRPDELIREARGYSSFNVGAQLALSRWYNYKLQEKFRIPE